MEDYYCLPNTLGPVGAISQHLPKGKASLKLLDRTDASHPIQPEFCPAWCSLEALIMFAGCLQCKRQCPESPYGFSQACVLHPPIWGAE